jgi:hypothetical protein
MKNEVKKRISRDKLKHSIASTWMGPSPAAPLFFTTFKSTPWGVWAIEQASGQESPYNIKKNTVHI